MLAARLPMANARSASEREERDHRRDPEEAELLADHREEEIGVRLGQIEELLHAAAETHAEATRRGRRR